MRIQTFIAPNMADAMEQVRIAMGDDAIIIATQEDKTTNTVEVRAAVERLSQKAPPPAPSVPEKNNRFMQDLKSELAQHAPQIRAHLDAQEPAQNRSPEQRAEQDRAMKRLLTFHGCSQKLGTALLSAYTSIKEDNVQEALTRIIELRFPMEPLPVVPTKPVMLVGPAGAGKTVMAAKLAARAILSGADAYLITTDLETSGALEKITRLAEVMGRTVITAESPADLQARIGTLPQSGDQPAAIIIDTPAVNPYDAEDMKRLAAYVYASNVEPVLVLAAGGDRNEMSDQAEAFSACGIERVMITRLDATRRLGSVLSAIDASMMTLSHFSDSAYVGRGFERFTPEELARRLLRVPQRTPDHQPYYANATAQNNLSHIPQQKRAAS